MDGVDLVLGSTREALTRETSIAAPERPASAPSAPEPASLDEIAAIVAVVPRSCRANAEWAVPLLLDTARTGGITHPRRIAYVLATAQHSSQFGARLVENGTGPVVDGVDCSFEQFEPGTPLGSALGNTQTGDGERFRGRGFNFVRGRASYSAWSQRLAMPDHVVDGTTLPYFIARPDAMGQRDVAAQTLIRGMRDGIFTGIALGYYVNDKRTDFYSARRVIDGSRHAREVAEIATTFARAIEALQSERHRTRMQQLAHARAADGSARDFMQEIGEGVERLARRGDIMPPPVRVIEWDGEVRQGKFIQLDDRTCALHTGRGVYVRLDIQRDLNGVVPAEGRNMALKRSGDVRPAMRAGEVNSWR